MDDFEFGFADLFGSDDDADEEPSSGTTSSSSTKATSAGKKMPRAPAAARSTNHSLVGLVNQGATCYMNALLQALYFTPGFREQLLALTLPASRVIPLQLQRLLGKK